MFCGVHTVDSKMVDVPLRHVSEFVLDRSYVIYLRTPSRTRLPGSSEPTRIATCTILVKIGYKSIRFVVYYESLKRDLKTK
jgi:hypothetical protein